MSDLIVRELVRSGGGASFFLHRPKTLAAKWWPSPLGGADAGEPPFRVSARVAAAEDARQAFFVLIRTLSGEVLHFMILPPSLRH